MELRVINDRNEREIFAAGVARARAMGGQGFVETENMRDANQERLAAATLYALFETDTMSTEYMIAGLAMHDLDTWPQTCPEPDLSYLSSRSVIEFSDFWSLSRGAGMLAWCGAAVPVVALEARTLLVYLAAHPFDNTVPYAATGWIKAGQPVVYPFLKMLDGQEIWSQPMILEGRPLQKLVKVASRIAFKSADEHGTITLKSPFGLGGSPNKDIDSPGQPEPPAETHYPPAPICF